MIILDGLRLLGQQDSITLWLHSCIQNHAAPHLLELLEPIGYGSALRHLSLGSFRTHMLCSPGPDWTMEKIDADAKG